MLSEILKEVQGLQQESAPFAIAMVINRVMPSSGKPGDKAIIREDGTVSGWIGGGCTRGIVIKEALDAIEANKPRIVRIHPDGNIESKPGVVDYKMTCHSGGAVELYIEPVLPKPHLLILGKSHIAMALSKVAKTIGYNITVMANGAEKYAFPDADLILDKGIQNEALQSNSCIVVCTQGEQDEDALEWAIKSGVSYVSFVSSRKKAHAVFNQLKMRGITIDQLKQIKTPAGLDIGAKTPEEVAISILAELIAHIRNDDFQPIEVDRIASNSMTSNSNTSESGIYINPVCGIPVEKSTAKHILEHAGQKVYFCCDGCKVSFEKEPEKYMEV